MSVVIFFLFSPWLVEDSWLLHPPLLVSFGVPNDLSEPRFSRFCQQWYHSLVAHLAAYYSWENLERFGGKADGVACRDLLRQVLGLCCAAESCMCCSLSTHTLFSQIYATYLIHLLNRTSLSLSFTILCGSWSSLTLMS